MNLLFEGIKKIEQLCKKSRYKITETQLGYVPNCYEKGTPKNPSMCYLSLEVDMDTEDDEIVIDGWVYDYPYWTYYG